MTMETMQRTSYIRHQYSEQRVSSMSMSRNATRNQILPPPKQVEPDPKKVKKIMDAYLAHCKGTFTINVYMFLTYNCFGKPTQLFFQGIL